MGLMDVEARIATEMVRRAFWFVPLMALAVGVVRGLQAGLAALIGAALVVLNFWGWGKVLAWSGRRSPQVLGAAAFFGFLARLLVLFAAVWLLLALGFDRTGLLVGVGVSYVGLLVMQAKKELIRP
jgi:hypothetical protein